MGNMHQVHATTLGSPPMSHANECYALEHAKHKANWGEISTGTTNETHKGLTHTPFVIESQSLGNMLAVPITTRIPLRENSNIIFVWCVPVHYEDNDHANAFCKSTR
jgi:hypothetical protein